MSKSHATEVPPKGMPQQFPDTLSWNMGEDLAWDSLYSEGQIDLTKADFKGGRGRVPSHTLASCMENQTRLQFWKLDSGLFYTLL